MPWFNATEIFDGQLLINDATGVSIERGRIVGKSAKRTDVSSGWLINFGYTVPGNTPDVLGIKYRVDYWLERCANPSQVITPSRVQFPTLLKVQTNLNDPPPAPSFVPAQGRAAYLPSGSGILACGFGLAYTEGFDPVFTDFSLSIFFLIEPEPIPGQEPKVQKRNFNPVKSCDISDTWSRCK